jgi:uncharacterized repeat protein (TIGR04076 family)
MGRDASKLQVTIKDIEGTGKCPQGFNKGDTWVIEKNITPANFCMSAFGTIYPTLRTMRYGGEHPWGESDVTYACCPDFHNLVIFEIKRLPMD